MSGLLDFKFPRVVRVNGRCGEQAGMQRKVWRNEIEGTFVGNCVCVCVCVCVGYRSNRWKTDVGLYTRATGADNEDDRCRRKWSDKCWVWLLRGSI